MGAFVGFEQCTLDDVAAALRFIDDAHDRDVWVRMGMAIKSEFGADGFDAWDEWSQTASNYKPAAARATYKSFKAGGGVTIASLFKLAIERGYRPERKQLTAAEQQELARQREERTKKRLADEAREAAEVARWYELVAQASQDVWSMLQAEGDSPYLARKQVPAYGVGFPAQQIILVFREDPARIDLLVHREQIADFWANRDESVSFRQMAPGDVVVPMFDITGTLRNLQVIYRAGAKNFLKHGPKSGLFFRLGDIAEGQPLMFAEGYATAASIHLATGLPVVVTFDEGNLRNVPVQYRERLPGHLFLIVGDNDAFTDGNPGLTSATEVAQKVGGIAVVPRFNGVTNG